MVLYYSSLRKLIQLSSVQPKLNYLVSEHHPYGRKQRTKEPLDESESESEKVGLKLNIQKTKIMASGPLTS